MSATFFSVFGLEHDDNKGIKKLSLATEIPVEKLKYYNTNGILPTGLELESLARYLGKKPEYINLMMGVLNEDLKHLIAKNADLLVGQLNRPTSVRKFNTTKPVFQTKLGKLYRGDCLEFLKQVPENSYDVVFADPPFNLNKFYLSNIDDALKNEEYINWTESWLEECVRTLKPGGSLFLWNLPKWNSHFSAYLNRRLSFRHWIATDIKYSLPIQGRLYPSHYSLLYYCKGDKPKTFHPDRLPMDTCPKCYTDLKDYGGYKDKMNPLGVNLCDVWYDIPPVRHKKYKKRSEANELSIKLLDRIIEMSSNEGDVIFDPFGGSGTTYIVAEIKKRKWVGIELGPLDTVMERLENVDEERTFLSNYRLNYNKLFTDKTKAIRKQLKLWTDDSFNKKKGIKKSA